jgi:glycosyltransferase involved in cell wall biosynthesis
MSRPIKLLRIAAVGNDRRGGMSRTMHLTGDYLSEDGFEVRYLFWDAFRWRMHRGLMRFTLPWESGVRVRQAIREWGGCDLVEVHEPLSIGCTVARAMEGNTRVIGFSYGVEFRSRTATESYRASHGIPSPLKGRITGWLQGRVSLAGLKRCDHVVCSNSEDIHYLQSHGMPADKLTRHFSGVDDSLLARAEGSPRPDPKRVLFFGAWIDRKGTAEIVKAVTEVLRIRQQTTFTAAGTQIPDSDVLGAFPEDVRPRITVLRRIESEEELARVYSSHGILLLPSYYEGQPLVMIEAAAFGLAILTTPVCGMLDFVREGENGLFAPVGDAPAFTRALLGLIDDPERVSRMGEAARITARAHTWRASAQNLAQAYRRVLECRS